MAQAFSADGFLGLGSGHDRAAGGWVSCAVFAAAAAAAGAGGGVCCAVFASAAVWIPDTGGGAVCLGLGGAVFAARGTGLGFAGVRGASMEPASLLD